MTAWALAAALWAFQSPEPPTPMTIRAEPDTVRVGEHIRLVASVPVPPGHTLFVPDTLSRAGPVETREPARWSVSGVRGDTTEVRVTYTLAAYRPGPTPLPPVSVVVRNRPPDDEWTAERLDGGGFVGEWADLPRVPDFTFVRRVIEGPEIYTAPTILEFDLMEGAAPREAMDVAGGSWSALVLALAALVVCGSGATTYLGVRRYRTSRARKGGRATSRRAREEPWRRALGELERIHALGLHRMGEVEEFYARSTDAVRRYVETLEPGWGPHLTSTELLLRAERKVGPERVDKLAEIMLRAETVKFGGADPGPGAAERDWTELRSWVAEAGTS